MLRNANKKEPNRWINSDAELKYYHTLWISVD